MKFMEWIITKSITECLPIIESYWIIKKKYSNGTNVSIEVAFQNVYMTLLTEIERGFQYKNTKRFIGWKYKSLFLLFLLTRISYYPLFHYMHFNCFYKLFILSIWHPVYIALVSTEWGFPLWASAIWAFKLRFRTPE